MKLEDLDGYYRVFLASDGQLPEGMYEMERGDVIFRLGVVAGVDAGGCTVTGRVTLTGSDTCRIDAILDPRTGKPDMVMFQADGSIAREPTPRCANFKVRMVDDQLVLHGSSNLGGREWKVTAQRIGALDYEDIRS